MTTEVQQAKAATFRALHEGSILLLPNAWDAGSAAVIAQAGAEAIATTSGGVAWSVGRGDGEQLTRTEMIEVVRRIVAAVDVPVSADVEGGYGPSPKDVAATVEAVIDVGAVGVNLEDSRAPGGPLFSAEEHAARLEAGRAAAARSGLPEFYINVRTDVFLFGIGEPEGRVDDVLARAHAYASAGADCLFVPGLVDLGVLKTLVDASPLPIAVMAGQGAPTASEFQAIGVRRLSLGTGTVQAAYAVADRATRELLDAGTYDGLGVSLDYGTINSLFNR